MMKAMNSNQEEIFSNKQGDRVDDIWCREVSTWLLFPVKVNAIQKPGQPTCISTTKWLPGKSEWA